MAEHREQGPMQVAPLHQLRERLLRHPGRSNYALSETTQFRVQLLSLSPQLSRSLWRSKSLGTHFSALVSTTVLAKSEVNREKLRP